MTNTGKISPTTPPSEVERRFEMRRDMASRLRQLLKDKGLTQVKLAALMGAGARKISTALANPTATTEDWWQKALTATQQGTATDPNSAG